MTDSSGELGMQKPYNMSLYPGTGSADGRRGDHIILAPAYNVTSSEIRHIVETVTAVVSKYFKHNADDWLDGAVSVSPKIEDQAPPLVEVQVTHKPRR